MRSKPHDASPKETEGKGVRHPSRSDTALYIHQEVNFRGSRNPKTPVTRRMYGNVRLSLAKNIDLGYSSRQFAITRPGIRRPVARPAIRTGMEQPSRAASTVVVYIYILMVAPPVSLNKTHAFTRRPTFARTSLEHSGMLNRMEI